MGIRDLKARYGTSLRTSQAFNRAIRAEIPGGAAVLDALGLVGSRKSWEEIKERLLHARAETVDVIAARYNLQSRTKGVNDERRSD